MFDLIIIDLLMTKMIWSLKCKLFFLSSFWRQIKNDHFQKVWNDAGVVSIY